MLDALVVSMVRLEPAQTELDRYLFPVNPHWHGTESAIVRNLPLRIPI
jgi:hypothetical protein